MIVRIVLAIVLGSAPIGAAAAPTISRAHIILAQHQPQAATPQAATPQADTPQERMRRRFPQPVRVGDLVGLRVLDDHDVTIGIVRQAVRAADGSILLIVAHSGVLGWGGRLVAVPIEAVAMLGRQLASLDMKPEEYASAPTWTGAAGQVLPPDEKILIGLTRR
jgi:hypothetical protein